MRTHFIMVVSQNFLVTNYSSVNHVTYCNCGVIPDPSVTGVAGVLGCCAGVGGYKLAFDGTPLLPGWPITAIPLSSDLPTEPKFDGGPPKYQMNK